MYELFILSKLLHRPMHGYLIHTILNFAIGPSHRLSWGTLYPLMKKLECNGYIAAIDRGQKDPRGKTRYRTTELGRTRLLALMKSRGRNANSSEMFRIKLGCFGHLNLADRIATAKDYRSHLEQVITHSKAMMERVEQDPNLLAEERAFALLGLENQKAVTEFEANWVDSLVQALAGPPAPMTIPKSGRKKRSG